MKRNQENGQWLRWVVLLGVMLLVTTLANSRFCPADETTPRQGPKPAEKLLDDKWYDVYFGETKAGTFHSLVKETAKGDETIVVSDNSMEMKLARFGVEITVTSEEIYQETKDGAPLGFYVTQKMSDQPMETRGEIKGGELILTTGSGEDKHEEKLKWEKDAILSYAMSKLYQDHPFKPGQEFSCRTFMTAQGNRFTTVTVKMVGTEEITVGDKKMKLNKYSSSCDVLPGVDTTEWRNEKCELIQSATTMMGIKMTMVLSKGKSNIVAFDATNQILIECKTKLPASKEVLYKLTPKEGELNIPGLADNRQKVEKQDKDVIILRTKQITPDETKVYQIPYSRSKEMAEYLEDNALLQCNDKELKETAQGIIGSEKNAWKAGLLLEKWVHDNMTNRGYGVALASAKETLKTRAGACTQHAMLLAALARAVGIPSRVAVGITYAEIEKKSYFGGHMWTEVFVGDRPDDETGWIPLDGTRAQGGIDARYISFVKTSLKGGTLPPEASAVLAKVIGEFYLEVTDYTPQK